MNPTDEIRIPLSKTKVIFLLLGSIVFVGLGIWLLLLDADQRDSVGLFRNAILLKAAGAASVIFFGICAAFGFRKLIDTTPGLIVSANGITDNSSAISAGFIAWSEISEIGTFEAAGQSIVVIKVNNAEKYVERGNFIQRKLNRANLNYCGSPICISANSLKLNFQELTTLLTKSRSAHSPTRPL
jgi:hypothetical protein